MTKEEYIEMRKMHPTLPMELFFNYWMEKKPPEYEELNFEQFTIYFGQFIHSPLVAMNIHAIGEKVLRYYDEKFNIVKIIN